MNIALIHNQYATKKGGMESYLFNLLSGFAEQEDNTTVFTYKVDRKAPIFPNSKIIQSRLALYPKLFRKYFFLRRINKEFKRDDFDLSLSMTRTASQDLAICGGTHLGHLKYLARKPRLKDRLEIYFEKKSFSEARHIVAHSQILKDEIQSLYQVDARKIHLIYPPIDPKQFHYALKANKNTLAKRFGISRKKTTLLFPSTGHKRKGLVELAAAMQMFPENEVELLITAKPVAASLMGKNMRYLGVVENMAHLYAAVDFMILPAHYEPFGLVALESVQCGTPVIISNKVGAKDILTKNEALIMDNAITPQNIAKAIQKARQMRFHIAPNFAEQKGLTIAKHIAVLKGLVLTASI